MLKKIIRQFIFAVLVFTSALAISAHSALASDWVEEGWSHIEQNDVNSALAVWQSGVNALPASQLLIFTGVYAGPGDAVRQLKRAGKDQRAIILQADFKGKSAYYVMSAVDVPADRETRRQKLADLRKAINASSWLSGNSAVKFQSATNTIESIPTTIAAEPATATSDEETFPINSFEILGNVLVSTDVIHNGLSAHFGPRQTREDIFKARQTIIELYRKAGFDMVAVGLPDRNDNGTIALRIFEDDIKSQDTESIKTEAEQPEARPSTTAIKQGIAEKESIDPEPTINKSTPKSLPIHSFDVQGNTLISSETIQQKLKPFQGPNQTRADLFKAKRAIEILYTQTGYENVAVGLPDQISSGSILLQIFEDDIQSPVAAAAVSTPKPPVEQAETPLSTDWVQQGWQAIDQADIATALTVWQQGVNSLPSTKLLIFTGVYAGTVDAIKQLKRAGRDQEAIILKSDFHGKQAYYVMSAVDVPADRTARREKLATLRKAINAPGWLSGNAAKKFQTAASPATKAQEAEPKASTVAVKKEASEIKENTFPIETFDIQGNALVSTDEIQSKLTVFLGPDKTYSTLFQARNAIEQLYSNAGYENVAVGLPGQINSKNVPLLVFEDDIQTTAALTAAPELPTVPDNIAISSDWIQQGWQAIDQADITTALTVWQQGVNSLPSTQLLIFAGVYAGTTDALKQLKRAGREQQAIILKSDFKGKPAYYVMSAVDVPADKTSRRKKLAGLRAAINAPGWLSGNEAKKFQTVTAVQEDTPAAEQASVATESQPTDTVGEDKKETFPIHAFDIQGNTLVSTEDIQQKLKSYLGPNQARTDIFSARQSIVDLYFNAGFGLVAVGVPEQSNNGVIPLRIFEDDITAEQATNGKAAKLAPAQPVSAITADWIDQGWNLIEQNKTDAALAIWQQGVNSLPSSKILIFTGVYIWQADAVRQLKRAGHDQKAIILHADFKGKKAYYVMSAVDVPVDTAERRAKLAPLRQAINASSWLYGNEAGKFQTAASLIAKTPEAEPEPATFAVQKEPTRIREKSFPIEAFDIQGNTLLSTAEIQSRLAAFLGPDKTRSDLILAKRTIVAMYRSAGFEMVAVGLPKRIKSAKIPLRIVEVKVGEITVSGDTFRSEKEIIAMLPGLRTGKVASSAELKKQLEQTGKITNIRSARLVYHPTAQGTVDVEVVVDEVNPLKLGFMASNLGTKEAGRTLFTAFMYHNNLWNRGHEATLSYTKSERIKNLLLYSAMYEIPIQLLDGKLKFGIVRANLSDNQIDPILLGSGVSLMKTIHYEQPLYKSASMHHFFDIGYEMHRFDQTYQNTLLAIPAFGIRTNAKPVIFTYGFTSTTASGDYNFKASYLHNLPGGLFNNDANYQLLNVASKAGFRIIRLEAGYSYAWLNGWTFGARLAAQKTNNALIPGEHFFLTGLDKVRGFAQDDASGDSGILTRLELTTPAWLEATRFHAFMDAGRYEVNFPLPLELRADNIVSGGLGLHWKPSFGLDIRLEGGIVIDGTRLRRPGDVEAHFKAIYWLL